MIVVVFFGFFCIVGFDLVYVVFYVGFVVVMQFQIYWQVGMVVVMFVDIVQVLLQVGQQFFGLLMCVGCLFLVVMQVGVFGVEG